jgi:hypothetical protein
MLGTAPINGGIHRKVERANQVLKGSIVRLYLVRADSCTAYDHQNLRAGKDLNNRAANIKLADGRIYEVANAPTGWEESLESGSNEILIPVGLVISLSGTINVKGKKLIKVNGSRKKDGMFHCTLLRHDNAWRTPNQERNIATLRSG